MDKFGIFDLIEKISPLKDALKPILSPSEKKTENNENKDLHTPLNSEKNKATFSREAVYAFLKKHEETSKRIDKNLKK